MFRILSALLLTSIFLTPPSVLYAFSDWTSVSEKLAKSVVFIESKSGTCTGFVIDSARKYVMTVAHCDGPELYADQGRTKIIAKDIKKDLMVLHVEDLDRPAVTLAKDDPKVGTEVVSYGFGYGFERPMLRITHIADNQTFIPDFEGGPYLIYDSAFVTGQSGGPVVNSLGLVVGIVKGTSPTMGIGLGAEAIKSKMGRYFGKTSTD